MSPFFILHGWIPSGQTMFLMPIELYLKTYGNANVNGFSRIWKN